MPACRQAGKNSKLKVTLATINIYEEKFEGVKGVE